MDRVLFKIGKFNIKPLDILLAVLILALIFAIFWWLGGYKLFIESWEPGTTDRVLIPYPPHVRVTGTGLKYYNQPPDVNLRRQLNVPILPPIIVKSPTVNAMGAVPIVQPPPPSQVQVANYPPSSTTIPVVSLENAPVSVKLGVPPSVPVIGAEVNIPAVGSSNNEKTGNYVESVINGGNDEVESYY